MEKKKPITKKKAKVKAKKPLYVLKATSILDAFDKASAILKDWDSTEHVYCWFRGVKNNKLSLQPGAVWRANYDERGPLLDLCQQGLRFANVEGFDAWSTYYLAQHFGIPTRLLDWSESFMAACFFAFDGADDKMTPCVWLLRPDKFNKLTIGWDGIVAPEHKENLDGWLPSNVWKKKIKISSDDRGTAKYDNRNPIAIYPRQDNARIQNQKGFFTLHGQRPDSIEEIILTRHKDPRSVLARIDFDVPSIPDAIRQLELLGTRRSSIYPDTTNFVQELKETHGW